MSDTPASGSRRIARVGLVAFALLSAALILVYYLFLAKDYTVLFENLRESDTSAVTAELDKEGIGYRLENDGHTVLVDKGDVASARVAVAAANILGGGDVGFELFNDSDIGLSEFSQKMNYLRALQGELTRTIMAMDGVRFARVHLALPERSIFRGEQARPSAAITIQTADGQPLAQDRVEGLQQLVAASVTDLAPEQVVILDDAGTPLSAPAPVPGAPGGAISERAAFEQYAKIRAGNAVRDILGDTAFELNVSARELTIGTDTAGTAGTNAAVSPPVQPRIRIALRTSNVLPSETQALLTARIAEQLSLDIGAGDRVEFQTGIVRAPLTAAAPPSQPAQVREAPVQPATNMAQASPWSLLASRWIWLLFGVIAVILWLIWRQRGSLSEPERQHFADTLAEELALFRSERRD